MIMNVNRPNDRLISLPTIYTVPTQINFGPFAQIHDHTSTNAGVFSIQKTSTNSLPIGHQFNFKKKFLNTKNIIVVRQK